MCHSVSRVWIKLDSDQEPGGSGLYLARKSQVIVVIRIEKSTMEWYSVDKCGAWWVWLSEGKVGGRLETVVRTPQERRK